MIYLIDGHNLIPKMRGVSLSQVDDEDRLLTLLSEYSRLSRRKLEVFFDQAAIGHSGQRKVSTLKVVHVRTNLKADEAIIGRVLKANINATAITVVTSDRHIQDQVRYLGAKIMTSEQFSAEVENPTIPVQRNSTKQQTEPPLSSAEIADWVDFFRNPPPTKKY